MAPLEQSLREETWERKAILSKVHLLQNLSKEKEQNHLELIVLMLEFNSQIPNFFQVLCEPKGN